MAIKKLQNNFTTPEQSKRLLELGVPAGSADCYFFDWKAKFKEIIQRDVLPDDVSYEKWIIKPDSFNEVHKERYLPCWSVGRLIEIIRECATDFDVYKILIETLIIPTADNVDVLVRLMTADEFKSSLDFSKLED